MTDTKLAGPEDVLEKTDSGTFARWGAKRPAMRSRNDLFLLFMMVIMPVLGTAVLIGLRLANLDLIFAGLMVGVGATIYGNVRDAPKGIRALASYPTDAAVYPVSVVRKRSGVAYGTDDGVMIFSDGWMHYEGFGFSCSVRNCDCVLSVINPYRLTLRFEDGHEMSMKVYVSWGDGPPRIYRRDARRDAEQWSYASAPAGISVLPPRRFRRRPKFWAEAVAYGIADALLWALVANAACNASLSIGFAAMLVALATTWIILFLRSRLDTYRSLLPEDHE